MSDPSIRGDVERANRVIEARDVIAEEYPDEVQIEREWWGLG